MLDVATAEYVAEREPTWSKGWRDAVESFFRDRVLLNFGAERHAHTVTRADVERFRSGEIGRPKRNGDPVSNATVNRMMAALAAFGSWCLVEGRQYHTTNPWAGHEPLPEDDLPVPTLEQEQLDKVLVTLEGPQGKLPSHGARRFRAPWRLIVEFSRETGLRKGELGRLARKDIDLRSRTVFVVSSRRRGRTKGGKMRPFPLSARALEILAALPQREDGLVFGRIPDARRAFRRAAVAAGLERVWLHLFRHLFASRLSERGAGRAELRDAGGWSSSRMADRYTHARMERLRQLVEEPAAAPAGRTRDGLAPDEETGDPE
jgi:integrase